MAGISQHSAAQRRTLRPRLPSTGGPDMGARITSATTALNAMDLTTDWAQVRPEWGLANCAAFIVAPRSRSQHLNLEGRSFLHDYQWQRDPSFGVLELIMTAPMVVTNWINLQYHASTVDNPRYGSGDKVLHNVVGGNVGCLKAMAVTCALGCRCNRCTMASTFATPRSA